VNVSTEADCSPPWGTCRTATRFCARTQLTSSRAALYINNRHKVTIRGTAGSTNVVLVGKGMDNSNYGSVPFGHLVQRTNTPSRT